MKIFGGVLWVIGLLMAGCDSSVNDHVGFIANSVGLIIFLIGSIIIIGANKAWTKKKG